MLFGIKCNGGREFLPPLFIFVRVCIWPEWQGNNSSMAYVLAVLMAALSFLVNRAALRYLGVRAVVSLGPAVEEAAKTLPAFYLGADIALTHAVFGAIEAGYDWLTSRRFGAKAAVLSLTGHSLFGLATVGVLAWTGSVALAVAVGLACHLAWNIALIRQMTEER